MEFNLANSNTLSVWINAELYSEDVIYKCFYWYGGAFSVSIEKENTNFKVNLKKLENEISNSQLEALIQKIKTDLLDYKTRQIIYNETKNIRQILIAKAFSRLDDFDETPKGDIEDPLGFKFNL